MVQVVCGVGSLQSMLAIPVAALPWHYVEANMKMKWFLVVEKADDPS